MKKTAFLTTFLILLISAGVSAAPRDIERHWTGNAVNTLLSHGVVDPYPDGRFKPDKAITKEEAAAVFANIVKDLENGADVIEGQDVYFWDVPPERWTYPAISYLARNNMILPNEDGSFWPEAPISREELAYMIHSYMKIKEPWWEPLAEFSDIDSSFAKEAIQTVCTQGVMSGYPDGTFRPGDAVPRGEAMAILYSITGWDVEPVQRTLPVSNTISVPYISQLNPVYAVVGCEGTSLLMGLKGKGYAQDVSLREFLDAMPKHSSNPAKGFVGSPYKADPTKKTRTTIYPAVLAEYASAYGNVSDFSGSSPLEIQAEILAGNPVVIYATMRWEKPFYRWDDIEGQSMRLLSNNHAVLLCGYDSETNYYYVADPYNDKNTSAEYRYWISADIVDPIYRERYHSIVVE